MKELDLFFKILALKDQKRQGWVARKVENPESIADHSFQTAFMALILSRKFNLNVEKCVSMALVHDICESIVPDYTPMDTISEQDKYTQEYQAMIKLSKDFPDIFELWEEYEAQVTPEAKLLKQIDKIEPAIQSVLYEKKGTQLDMIEMQEQVITDPYFKDMLQQIKKIRKK